MERCKYSSPHFAIYHLTQKKIYVQGERSIMWHYYHQRHDVHGSCSQKMKHYWFRDSGNADLNVKKGVFCIDDPAQGAALYRLQSGVKVKTYPVTVTRSMRDCSLIVIGSDHGFVYVFDRQSGNVLDKLEISGGNWFQTITVSGYTNAFQ